MRTAVIRWAITVMATALFMPLALAEQDTVSGAEAGDRRCLPISHIRRIEIIDDNTLHFHMRGDQHDYLNRLPHRCSGLKSHGTFMHSTSTSNYCDLDTITVLDTSLGMRLGSCPLGRFETVERGSGNATPDAAED